MKKKANNVRTLCRSLSLLNRGKNCTKTVQNYTKVTTIYHQTIQKSPLAITKLETVVHFQAIASCLLGLRKLGEGSWM